MKKRLSDITGGTIDETNLVHKTGDENISGNKTFNSSIYVKAIAGSLTRIPTIDSNGQIKADDSFRFTGNQIVVTGDNNVGFILKYNNLPEQNGFYFYNGAGGPGNFGIFDISAGLDRFILNKDGNIGINTLTPTEKLEVNGTISITNNDPNKDLLKLKSTNTNGFSSTGFFDFNNNYKGSIGYAHPGSNSSAKDSVFFYSNNVPIRISTGSSSTPIINILPGDDKIGIGTTSPKQKLHVEGYIYTSQQIEFASSVPGYFGNFEQPLGIEIGFSKPNVQLFTINLQNNNSYFPNGKVGIGNNNPTEALDVTGNVKAQKFIGDGSLLTNVSGSHLYSQLGQAEDGSLTQKAVTDALNSKVSLNSNNVYTPGVYSQYSSQTSGTYSAYSSQFSALRANYKKGYTNLSVGLGALENFGVFFSDDTGSSITYEHGMYMSNNALTFKMQKDDFLGYSWSYSLTENGLLDLTKLNDVQIKSPNNNNSVVNKKYVDDLIKSTITKTYVDNNDSNLQNQITIEKNRMDNLVANAPQALDTLKEISDQLAADEQGTAAILATQQQHTQQLANVVHLTGDETVSGSKNFTQNLGVRANSPQELLSIGYGQNSDLSIGSETSNKFYIGTYKDNAVLAINRRVSDGSYANGNLPTASIQFTTTDNDSSIQFLTSPSNGTKDLERVNITRDGKVGIGAHTPSEQLEVGGNVKAQKFIGDGSQLTNLPTGNSIKQFSEYTATTDGAQSISLSNGTGAVSVQVMEAPSNYVRNLYLGYLSVTNSVLNITADANIKAGDKIIGNYY